MTASTTSSASSTAEGVLHQTVLGSRRASNYFWAVATSIGATGFLLAGLSSYLGTNLLPSANVADLVFVPQGLAMSFYGVTGLAIALYLWFVTVLNVGGGYNEFNQKTGNVRIFRWGFLGKNRTIDFTYPIEDVQAIRVEIKEGLNPRRVLYLRIRNRNDIPLTRAGQPMPIAELETQGAELARFLKVPLEGV